MSDHLPECYWPELPERAICICDRLRACEQRVREDMALQYLVSDREQQEQEERAFAAGVQAAVEAVKAYADERLVLTKHPNASEDITAALRVAAKRIEALGGKQ